MAMFEKRERKDGTRYRAKVRIRGFPMVEKTFDKLSDAKIWAQQIETSIRKGEFQNVIKEAQKHTLNDVIVRYRDEILPNKAKSTQRAESSYLKFWEKELGEYALSFIDTQTVSKLIVKIRDAGDTRSLSAKEAVKGPLPPKSPKTVKLYRNQIELLFTHARNWGWIGSSPVAQLQRASKANNSRVRFLDDEERESLLAACQKSPNPQLYTIVVFALSTGARLGEILTLTLNDINLKRGQAILRETKNGETRTVPIARYLNELLTTHVVWVEDHYAKQAPSLRIKYLFPRQDGMAPIDIRKAWENARSKAEILDFRFHDLRHSAASYLAMNGATLLEIAAVLGHKTLQMVKRYSHLSESHTASIVSKMNDSIFK